MKNVLNYFFCHRCNSRNLTKIDSFQGERVKPEPIDDSHFGEHGFVLKCKDCGEITGWLIVPRGVISVD